MKMIDLNCPKCGAPINPDMEKDRCECKYCGHQMLIEKEDTLEEIAAKAQSKSYGYHKGKLQAEAEAGIIREGAVLQKKSIQVALIIIIVLAVIGMATTMIKNFAKPRINPFDYIEVSFQGTDGDGELVMQTISKDNVAPHHIEYEISKAWDLMQGETISIVAASSEYRLTETFKTYIVEGLDEYLKSMEDIPEGALELIHQKALSEQELNLSHVKKTGVFVDMKLVKLFLLTDGARNNMLCVVHEVKISTEEGDTIRYVSTGYEDVVLRKGVQTSLDLSHGVYYGNTVETGTLFYITGYETVEAARADILTSQKQSMEFEEQDY